MVRGYNLLESKARTDWHRKLQQKRPIGWVFLAKLALFKKNDQHTDFPGGHPPEYYPRLTLLNFTDRTGCGETT